MSVGGLASNGSALVRDNDPTTIGDESCKGGVFQGLMPWKTPLLEDAPPMVRRHSGIMTQPPWSVKEHM